MTRAMRLELASYREGLRLFCVNFDTFQSENHNYLNKDFTLSAEWLLENLPVSVLLTPPCESSTRSRFAYGGPPPLRSAVHPYGFPWLGAEDAEKVNDANKWLFRAWSFCNIVASKHRGWLAEFPEFLGRRGSGCPTNPVELQEFATLMSTKEALTGANFQCQFDDVDRKSLTRWSGNLEGLEDFMRLGWPLVVGGNYVGPLTTECGHQHHTATHGKNESGHSRTAGKTRYGAGLCREIARLFVRTWLRGHFKVGRPHAAPPYRYLGKVLKRELLESKIKTFKAAHLAENPSGFQNLVLGLTMGEDGKPTLSQETLKYGSAVTEFLALLKDAAVPDRFLFSTLHFNFETVAGRHKDTRFIGRSVIAALGDFRGGEIVFGEEAVDINGRWVAYYGDVQHSSKNFTGSRTSLVMYLDEAVWAADWDLLQDLRFRGFLANASWVSSRGSKDTIQVGSSFAEGSADWLRQRREAETSSDDEDGVRRPKVGEGHQGIGAPLSVEVAGRSKPFHDGGGLCSPGRWPPSQRSYYLSALGAHLRMRWAKILYGRLECSKHFDLKEAFCQMACGRIRACPFSQSMIDEGRRTWKDELLKFGTKSLVQHGPPPQQSIWLHQLSEHGRLCDDPDYRFMTESTISCAQGIITGAGRRMPRTPAVYERKTHWGALDDYTATKMLEGNYKSLDGHVSDVEKQFHDASKEGRMSEWSVEEAQKSLPRPMNRSF